MCLFQLKVEGGVQKKVVVKLVLKGCVWLITSDIDYWNKNLPRDRLIKSPGKDLFRLQF